MYEEYLALAKEARERAEKATKGPWHAWDRGIGHEVHLGDHCFEQDWANHQEGMPRPSQGCVTINDELRETMKPMDAEFIAAARQDVPALADAVDTIEKDARDLVEAVAAIRAENDALRAKLKVATNFIPDLEDACSCLDSGHLKKAHDLIHVVRAALAAIKQPELSGGCS